MATVAIFGAGQLGAGVAAILARRGRHRVLGPFSRAERHEALGGGADVVLISTTTRLADVADDIACAIAAGSHVLVSAEEAANPWMADPVIADELDRAAREAGVTVLGAGLNPGLIFDALVLTLLGAAPDDVDITVRRTVDISGFGPAVLARIGVGIEPSEFVRGVEDGEVLGHAGFPQSIAVVARALGRPTPRVDAVLEPLVTDAALTLPDGRVVAAGRTAGVDQTYRAVDERGAWYTATFVGHVSPSSMALVLEDVITLHRGGEIVQQVHVAPCFPAQSGSQHLLANSIDRVLAAPPGWLTVADLPPATRV